MISSYLNVLEDSLKKKSVVLDKIQVANLAQSDLLKAEKFDMEAYDRYVDEKDACIGELEKLDEGFESLYDKIREELLGNKALYAGQIKRIQDLISEITEKSVSIQALETRNRDAVTAYFSREKQALGQGRRNSKAAYGYYQNLNKAIQEDASIMDMKK